MTIDHRELAITCSVGGKNAVVIEHKTI